MSLPYSYIFLEIIANQKVYKYKIPTHNPYRLIKQELSAISQAVSGKFHSLYLQQHKDSKISQARK